MFPPFAPASSGRFVRPTFVPPPPSHLGPLPDGEPKIPIPHQETCLVQQVADPRAQVAAGAPVRGRARGSLHLRGALPLKPHADAAAPNDSIVAEPVAQLIQYVIEVPVIRTGVE